MRMVVEATHGEVEHFSAQEWRQRHVIRALYKLVPR